MSVTTIIHHFTSWGVAFDIKQESSDGHLGVYVSGDNNMIKNCAVTGSASSGIIMNGAINTITNCIVSACDYSVTFNAGILLAQRTLNDPQQGRALQVTHNTFLFNSRANLQVGSTARPQSAADRCKIMYNDFGAACYTSTESGSIAAQSSWETEVGYNWFHDVAGPGVGSIVMESDRGAAGWIVHHNVFWQGRGPASDGGFIRGFDWTFNWDDSNAKCFNNTVVDSTDPGHKDWQMLEMGTNMNGQRIMWPGFKANNIMAFCDTAPWKFADPVNRDYTLRVGSPAIDKGVTVPDWIATYQGMAPDLGAYEYGQPEWTAGADWQEQPWAYPPPAENVNGIRPELTRGLTATPRLRLTGAGLVIHGLGKTVWRLTVFSARGDLIVSHTNLSSANNMVSTASLACGIYFAKISAKNNTFLWKVIIR